MERTWVAAAVLLLAWTAQAGEEDKERLDALERENAELRGRVEKLEEGRAAASEAALEQAVETYVEDGLGLNLTIDRGEVRGVFQIFGDTGFRWDNPELANRSNAFFFDGSIDLFFTARVGDHFHALSETVFLTSIGTTSDASRFDQERLWGAWRFSDFVQVKLGLEHGPVSRWNNLYHHGRWLELTVQRPLLARFEGDGGILPMHNAGVEFSGTLLLPQGRLNYVVFVSNGRGPVPTDTQEFSDRNDQKALDLLIGLAPEGLQGLWIGVAFRLDKVPPDPTNPLRLDGIREYIGALQVDYRGGLFEVLAEFAYLVNDDRQSRTDFGHYVAYVQVGHHLRDGWTPYVRIDVRQMDQGDPYFLPLGRDLDIWELLFGVRHDLTENAALKLEIGFGERDERDGGGAVRSRGYIRVGLQVAFVF